MCEVWLGGMVCVWVMVRVYGVWDEVLGERRWCGMFHED